jgi:hypothetical protein
MPFAGPFLGAPVPAIYGLSGGRALTEVHRGDSAGCCSSARSHVWE